MASLNDIETKIQSIIDKLNIKTITGVLPLTFTTRGGNAVDWVIEGNDDNGTENLFDKETLTNGYVVEASGTQANVYRSYSDYIPIESSTTYYMEHVVGTSSFYSGVEYDVNKQTIGNFGILGNYNASGIYTSSANAKYIRVNIATTFMDIVTVVKGTTAPDHYIPYQQGVGEQRVDGYYVPLTISQAGQPDKTVDIYIGDSPLTEGETVSKTSTGVDIEMFEGENTISTTLYNNPKIKIYYKWR